MMLVRNIIIISCLLNSSLEGRGQSLHDLSSMRRVAKVNVRGYEFIKSPSDGPLSIFTSLFLGYKTFVSSQDAGNCSFSPSCSEYALSSIQKNGFVEGFIDFFDWLARCNGLSPEDYQRHPDTHLLLNPVESHSSYLFTALPN